MVTATSSGIDTCRTSSPKIAIRPPTAAVPATMDGALIAILDAPLALGESAHAGFARKEHELGARIATLSVLECRALHKRLGTPQHGDELANKFARLTIERRARLLAFLADARRREALAVSLRAAQGEGTEFMEAAIAQNQAAWGGKVRVEEPASENLPVVEVGPATHQRRSGNSAGVRT